MSLQIFHSLHLKMLAVRRWAKAKENTYKVKEASKQWFSVAGGKKAFCGSVIHLKCCKTGFKIFIYNMFCKKDPIFLTCVDSSFIISHTFAPMTFSKYYIRRQIKLWRSDKFSKKKTSNVSQEPLKIIVYLTDFLTWFLFSRRYSMDSRRLITGSSSSLHHIKKQVGPLETRLWWPYIISHQ